MAHTTTTPSNYPLTPSTSEHSLLAAAQKAAAQSSKPFSLSIRTSDLAPTPAPPPSPIDFGWESANSGSGGAAGDYFAQALGSSAKWRTRSCAGATPVSAS